LIEKNSMSAQQPAVIDYRQADAASPLLPQSSILASHGWDQLHLEVFAQPKFEIAEHYHTMHAIAYSPISADLPATSTGDRWLDGQQCRETRHQGDIAAAAPFYGMVLDEWLEAVTEITVPIALFFGGRDPFIPGERIQQIDDRFRKLNKDYSLQVYPEAGHGFFCNERADYNLAAAADGWKKLIHFFDRHLRRGADLFLNTRSLHLERRD
jgi:pimeloyl-ACP methyl ester carboxylesterase